MVKVRIDQKECIGCSFCMECAPKLFKFDESDFKGKINENGNLTPAATVDLSPDGLKEAKEAAEGCPTKAISIDP